MGYMRPTRVGPPIPVAFCTDAGYVPQLTAALVSLFESNWRNVLDLYVVTSCISPDHRDALEKLALTYGRDITLVDLDETPLIGLAEFFQPKSTYYRLLLPELLPQVDRLIYLDCDLVVEIDLRELWSIRQNEKLVLGVAERNELQPGLQLHVQTPGDPYLNAGVLVMALGAWRQEGVAARCLAWLKQNTSRATMMDQDAINHVCVGRKGYVDLKWNLNPIHGPARVTLRDFPERILHFAGPIKPWHEWYCQDLADIFYGYFKRADSDFALPQHPATKVGQHLSVANQHHERKNYEKAAAHYHAATYLITQTRATGSQLEEFCIKLGNQSFQAGDFKNACDIFRSLANSWGLPLSHMDIYKIPLIT